MWSERILLLEEGVDYSGKELLWLEQDSRWHYQQGRAMWSKQTLLLEEGSDCSGKEPLGPEQDSRWQYR
jgi:hypothetical protein